MNISVVTGPASEPLSLIEAKAHLRVENYANDNLIMALIVTAREWCEGFLNRALITQTRRLTISQWPLLPLRLPGNPIQSIQEISYIDFDGVEGTVNAGEYYLTASGEVVRSYNGDWPNVTLRGPGSIGITYVCGYGAAKDVPTTIKQAMLLLIGGWYEMRESAKVKTEEVPFGVRELLWPLRKVPV